MHVTLEQARAFDALVTHGTFVKAAVALRKRHTAILYAMRLLEEQTGLELLDRSGYRTKPTSQGARVLEHCRRLLALEDELMRSCHEMKTGWEPSLHVVFDGICSVEPLLGVVASLLKDGAPTRVDVDADFLSGVERVFVESNADLMVAVLPPTTSGLRSVELPPIRARLVAHRGHALVRAGARPTAEELAAHVLVTVRGSDPRLALPTAGLEQRTRVRLSDFAAKKVALMTGVGFGWMPEHMVKAELSRGVFREIRWREAHTFKPRLYFREGRKLGRAAARFVEELRA